MSRYDALVGAGGGQRPLVLRRCGFAGAIALHADPSVPLKSLTA